jgi:hypothetical protein
LEKLALGLGICGLAALTGALMDFVGGIFIEEPEALFTFALGAALCFVWLKKPKALTRLSDYVTEWIRH